MKIKSSIFLVLAFIMGLAFLGTLSVIPLAEATHADISVSSLPSNFGALYSLPDNVGEPLVAGVCFTPSSSGDLASAMFRLRQNGAATGTLSVKILQSSISASVNTNATDGDGCSKNQLVLVTSNTIDMQSLSGSFADIVFTFSSGTVVFPIKYSAVVFADFTSSGGTTIQIERSQTESDAKAYVDSICRAGGTLTLCDNSTSGDGSSTGQVRCDEGVDASQCFVHDVKTSAFDYSLSNSGPVTISQGSTGTVTITATLTHTPAKSVTLSCTGLPAGITCNSFTNNPCTPTCSSTLTIGVASPGSGTYIFSVTGSPIGLSTVPTVVTVNVPVPPIDCSQPGACGIGPTCPEFCGVSIGNVIASLILLFVVLIAIYVLQNFVLNPDRKPDEGGYGGVGGERGGLI